MNESELQRDDEELEQLLAKLRSGDELAAEEVWQRFAGPLLQVAYRRLDNSVRQKIDADDIVQSAFRTFFIRCRQGKFDLPAWGNLWAVLVQITARKCGRKSEYFRAQQRSVKREVHLNAGESSDREYALHSHEIPPHEQAVMDEIIGQILDDMTKPQHQTIALRLLEGTDIPSISAELGCTEYTVRRVMQKIRQRLEKSSE
jgi:RNA polymerase sigma-70 factor (ECF subfamily)